MVFLLEGRTTADQTVFDAAHSSRAGGICDKKCNRLYADIDKVPALMTEVAQLVADLSPSLSLLIFIPPDRLKGEKAWQHPEQLLIGVSYRA